MDSITQFRAFPDLGLELYSFQRLTRPFPPHFHKAFLIGCLTSGQRLLRAHGLTRVIGKDELVFLRPFTVHACSPLEHMPAHWLAVQLDAGKFPETKQLPNAIFAGGQPLAVRLQLMIVQAMRQKTPERQAWRDFLRSATRCPATVIPELPEGCHQGGFARMRQRLEAEPEQKTSLDAMAGSCGLDKFSFLRGFLASSGITPCKYIANLRVIKAQSLLRQGSDLSHCAIDCGFYDQSHFSRVFKSSLGLTPGHYRSCACHRRRSPC